MFPNFFLQHLGEPLLFQTVSSAWVSMTTSSKRLTKNKINNNECKELVNSEEGLDFLIEYFSLDEFYDGGKIKSMIEYHLKKKLDK